MKIFSFICYLFLPLFLIVFQSSAQDSTRILVPFDSLSQIKNDSITISSVKKLSRKVQIPTLHSSEDLIYSDSLGRWFQWNSIAELLFWNEGQHHFRTSSFIRPSYSIEQSLSKPTFIVDGIRIKSPLNQTILHSSIPFRNTDSIHQKASDIIISRKRMIQSHSVTELSAEESGYGYLNVYGSLYTPLALNQHLDISLWNKNEDDSYEQSKAHAKEMSVRYRYQLSNTSQLEASVQYSSIQMSESDGYYTDAIYEFDFDRFETVPHRRLARSSSRNSLYRVDLYEEDATFFNQISVFAQLGRRFFKSKKDSLILNGVSSFYPADTLDVGYNQYGVQLTNNYTLWGSQLDYSTQINYSSANQDAYSLPNSSKLNGLDWLEFVLEMSHTIDFSSAKSNLNTVYSVNSINGISGKLNYELVFDFEQSSLTLSSFGEQKQQPIYSTYISSYQTVGKSLASVQLFGGGLSWKRKTEQTSLDYSANASYESGNYGLKNNDFYLTDPQIQLSTSLFGSYKWNHFFISNQITATQYLNDTGFYPEQLLVWNRTSLYYEDYWFNRASFIRTGFSALFSPFSYATPTYSATFNDWFQANSFDQIPGFFRLDYELTARVRALFIYIRWENITQGVLQNGYFEHYSYPMYERRLRFGIKVQFIN